MEKRNQSASPPSCIVCGVTNVLRCAKCKTTYYCSSVHQQMDWPTHRQECRRLAKAKSNNKMQQLQQAVAAATLSNTNDASHQQYSTQQQGQPVQSDATTLDGAVTSTNLDDAPTMGINESRDMPHNHVKLVSQQNFVSYRNSMKATSGILEGQQFRGCATDVLLSNGLNGGVGFENGGLEGLIEGGVAGGRVLSATIMQNSQFQPFHQSQQFSNFNLDGKEERSSSYKIGRGDENMIGSVNERRYEELCRNIINDMNQYGLSVVDDFLGMEKGIEILNEVHGLYAAGVFKDGQLVNNFLPEKDSRTIRGDKITWVKGVEPGCTSVGYLVNQIDAVICRANTMKNNGKLGNYNIKERTKAMVACYPGSGSHYVVHVDNPNKDGRVITAIYYLNVNWDTKRSGGVLRIFPEHGNTIADIEPKFDRLIFFWSDKRNPHEVQPAHRTRYAITVWYFDAYEREAALNRCKSNGRTANRHAAPMAKRPMPTTNNTTDANVGGSADTNTNFNTGATLNNNTNASTNLSKMANTNSANALNEICT